MSRSKLLAMLLGEKKVFSIPAKIIFGQAGNYGTEMHNELSKEGLYYMMFGGSGYVDDKILAPDSGWQMLECEIIVIPKRIYRKNKEPEFEHLQMSQALTSGFAIRDHWEECEEFN